jgi:hypothetical protein
MGVRRPSGASVPVTVASVILSLVNSLVSTAVPAQTIAPLPLAKAAAATELPAGSWGPYAQKHLGPCYMASRLGGQLFSFPMVIGQQREEIMLRPVRLPDGKSRLRPSKVTLQRRAMGLAPVQAMADSTGKAVSARMVEADAEGLLWSARIEFPPASVAQGISQRTDADGLPLAPSEWGAGSATVEYFPAYADPDVRGLVIRITLTNRSTAAQTYFVDLLGGIETENELFSARDLNLQIEEGNRGTLVQHPKSNTQFALASQGGISPIRTYRVHSEYFSSAGNVTMRNAAGNLLPFGSIGKEAEIAANDDNLPKAEAAAEDRKMQGDWGLTRVSDISLEAGQSYTVWLSVGVGRDAEAADASAHTLLRLAQDADPDAKSNREGLYALALAAHQKARHTVGDKAVERLMAQSLTNIPHHDARRVGVPTRETMAGWPGGVYRPGSGGWIALGWSVYRPDWSAAQLNAWFVTQNNPNPIARIPLAVPPIDLFALWDLYQSTHDRDMLELFYPQAKHRFIEFVEAGRLQENGWLFAWPAQNRSGMRLTRSDEGKRSKSFDGRDDTPMQFYSPDYSAYVICAARLLCACARTLNQPKEEIEGLKRVITEATNAMNANLWDRKRGVYMPKAVMAAPIAVDRSDAKEMEGSGLEGLMPLIAGPEALSEEQNLSLLKSLSDPAAFWGEAGLRSVSKSFAGYRPEAVYNGAVHFGAVWLFWKSLLDRGESEKARRLASNVLRAYRAAVETGDCCPEALNGDTGQGVGRTDYSGDACALLPLYAAYHTPGTITSGWDLSQMDSHYEKANDTLRVVFRSWEESGKGRCILLCVMGKPNGMYRLTGALSGTFTADADGVLTLTPPREAATQQIEISPVGGTL